MNALIQTLQLDLLSELLLQKNIQHHMTKYKEFNSAVVNKITLHLSECLLVIVSAVRVW